jgi:RNA polymerase primary sigma factor
MEELAAHMDLPVKKIRIIRRAVRSMQSAGQEPLDEHGNLVGMSEVIADDALPTPDEGAFQVEELRTLHKLLEAIDEREAMILRLRFGLDGREPMTLKQISDEVGLSRERVRQVVDEALTRLNAQLNDDRPSRFFKENRVPGRPVEVDLTKASRNAPRRRSRAAG